MERKLHQKYIVDNNAIDYDGTEIVITMYRQIEGVGRGAGDGDTGEQAGGR